MNRTENTERQATLGLGVMQEILTALKDSSSAEESVSNIKVQVPLPVLAELLSDRLGNEQVPEPGKSEEAEPASGSDSNGSLKTGVRPTSEPSKVAAGGTASGATLGSGFVGSD